MAQTNALFRAGLKIVGVLAILWAFTHIANVIYSFYSIFNQPNQLNGEFLSAYRFSLLFEIAVPVLLFVIGWFLLKSEKVLSYAFRDIEQRPYSDIEKYFILFMKLAGLVLLVYAIPKAFQLIGNVFFIQSTHSLLGTKPQAQTAMKDMVATLIELILGFYLLRSGKLFHRIGFRKKADEE